jgi:ribosomal protein S3
MGQKVNPVGLRLGVNRTWDSRWYASDEYAQLLHEDIKLRKYLSQKLSQAAVSKIVIERPAKKARVTIHTARPGIVIGRKGADIEKLRLDLSKMTISDVNINIVEIRKPEIDATLVAENIAQQLERRIAFRLGTGAGVTYKVSDSLTLSAYTASGDDDKSTAYELTDTGVGLSYTITPGMVLHVTHNEQDLKNSSTYTTM